MANEVTASATLSASKNGVQLACSHTVQLTLTGNDVVRQTITAVTASATALTFGAITGAPEKLIVKNLDSTNFVQVDSATAMDSGFAQKLTAGDVVLLSPQTATIYVKADTASCLLEYAATEA